MRFDPKFCMQHDDIWHDVKGLQHESSGVISIKNLLIFNCGTDESGGYFIFSEM